MTVVAGTTVPVPTRVLLMGLAHEDGTILAPELYAVAEACGQTPEQVRSCLHRLVNENAGWCGWAAATPLQTIS